MTNRPVPSHRSPTATSDASGSAWRNSTTTSALWNLAVCIIVLSPLAVLLVLAVGDYGTTTVRAVVSVAAVASVGWVLWRTWRAVDAARRATEQRGQQRFAALVEHAHDVVLLLDARGVIRYASSGLAMTTGHDPSMWIGRPAGDLLAEGHEADVAERLVRVIEAGDGSADEFETVVACADGARRQVDVVVSNLLDDDSVDGVVMTMRDVTEQRELERRLNHRANHDEMTGLANRALFLDRVDHALRVRRAHDDPVVVLFVDLDDFKAVNDALGHAVGDSLLAVIGQQIIAVSGPGDTPARLGGDEFAILMEDTGGIERAVAAGDELLDRLSRPQEVGGYQLTVNASVGVAVAAPGTVTAALLRDADTAMYEAKRAGKGQLKIFDPAMQLRTTGRLASETELASAFAEGQLRLVYQPFVSLETGKVLGAQAMVRWAHPERGDVPSEEFIPIAETTGLVGPIGRWILDEAIAEAATWQSSGDLHLGVKVPHGLLRAPGFVDHVAAALERTGYPAQLLGLAIPGNAVVDALDGAQGTLHRLRALGVLVSVSDFGAGDLALVDLRRASVDLMQIDRTFVEDLSNGSGLARVLLETCATLGMTSAANGIAKKSELTMLRSLGCHYGRGPLISPPLEVDEIRRRFGVGAMPPAYASVDA